MVPRRGFASYADSSSSDEEFMDFSDGPQQYESSDEETIGQVPSVPPQTRRHGGPYARPNSSNGSAHIGRSHSNTTTTNPNTASMTSSRRRAQSGDNNDFDTESDNEDYDQARNVDQPTRDLPRLDIRDDHSAPPASPFASRRSTTSPPDFSASTPITPEKRAERNKWLEVVMSQGSPTAKSLSPSTSGANTPSRRSGQPLARASTMPAPFAAPFSPSPQPVLRSNSMPNPSSPPSPPSSTAPEDYVHIAHDPQVQQMLDDANIPWAIQYELARGVSNNHWTWAEVTRDKIGVLAKGTNPRCVQNVMGKHIIGLNRDIWEELSREQKALLEGKGHGLGLLGDWEGEKNWYGGRVQQLARIEKDAQQHKYYLQLGAMQKVGRSHRLARFLGSHRVLHVKIPKEALYEQKEMDALKDFLSHKFVLCGRVFVSFAVKDQKIYLVETDEDFERTADRKKGDHLRYSLEKLIEWYNPLDLNDKQNLSKYAARSDLALSTSSPVLEFDPRNIYMINDIEAPHTGGKVPPEKIFTDGCGFMNGAALMRVGKWIGSGSPPTAVQGRILGSKGVWLLHPDDRAPTAEPRIWIRPSQRKIRLVREYNAESLATLHRAHLIFDLVMPSRSTVPARLSRLTIVNLAHNGVPTKILTALMEGGLKAEVEGLTQWQGASAMPLLWHAVNKASGTSFQRLRRTAAGIQRALGLTRRHNEDESDGEDDAAPLPFEVDNGDAVIDEPTKPDTDAPPPAIGEGILERIQAGFSPLTDIHLYNELKTLLKIVMESYIKDYHIIVPESAEAFIVPDPYGLLEEDEIHFKSSQDLKDACEHLNPKSVVGDVLIYRNPARVPSDVQKVRAVCRPEYADYLDVIILPTKGRRSLASLLAGGDYDGDVATCIFDPQIVGDFRQPVFTAEPPNFLEKYFESQDKIPTVASVVRMMSDRPADASRILRRHLLIGLTESKTGKYSWYNENAMYRYGYAHPDTIRLAFMFTTVLDSRKSGLAVKPEVVKADNGRFGFAKPECLGGTGNGPRRDHALGPFVLDKLLRAGSSIQRELLAKYDSIGTNLKLMEDKPDPDIERPWTEICNARQAGLLSEALCTEVGRLETAMREISRTWGAIWGPSYRGSQYATKAQKSEAKKKVQVQVDGLARHYMETPVGCEALAMLGNLDKLKASCLYSIKPKVAFKVCFQAVCKIKAESRGSKAFTREFADAMSIPAAEVRVRSQFNAAREDVTV